MSETAYDRWKTTTPADSEHLPECNCESCHDWHVENHMVADNALGDPQDYQCCVDTLEDMKSRGKVCKVHPGSYFEPADKKTNTPAYCENCTDSVQVRFAYYNEPLDEIPATACYIVIASVHPALPVHGNVGADQLMAARVDTPMTPTYQTWVSMGRPIYRGEVRL